MTYLTCPSCHTNLPAEIIPDHVLKSERGRRNSRRRKAFRGRPKGAPLVWWNHDPGVRRCLCGTCRLSELDTTETLLSNRERLGHESWILEEVGRVRELRAAIEGVVQKRSQKLLLQGGLDSKGHVANQRVDLAA